MTTRHNTHTSQVLSDGSTGISRGGRRRSRTVVRTKVSGDKEHLVIEFNAAALCFVLCTHQGGDDDIVLAH